jgi:hypothetical protein
LINLKFVRIALEYMESTGIYPQTTVELLDFIYSTPGFFFILLMWYSGVPVAIVSDRDTQFISKFWTHLTLLLGTRLRFSTAFHPQMHGLAEKANGTIRTFLKAYAVDNLQEWDRCLALAEFTYNASKNKMMQLSPFEVDIGYVPGLPLDIIAAATPRTLPKSNDISSEAEPFARTLQNKARRIRDRLDMVQEGMIELANRKQRSQDFRTGDKVLLDTGNLSIGYANLAGSLRKLQHRLAGPFGLGRQYGDNTFQLEDIPSHWKIHDVFNVDRFRRDTSDMSRSQQPPPPLRSTARCGADWEVEQIPKHYGTKMTDLEYKIKRVGYDESMWEPIDSLRESANELLHSYH